MTDYTPTTKGIKSSATEFNAKHSDEQFDRWLAEVKAEAWKEGYVAGFLQAIGGELGGSAGRTSVTREQVVRVLRRHELGVPNDDREAMLRRIESFDYGSDRVSDDLEQDIRELVALSRATVPDAATAEAKKQLGEIQRHFTAIAGSGEIRVYEDTGEKHGIDYQSSVWAKRGERMTRDLIEFLGEHHRPEPVENGESK